ncbi:hypothetical protein D3C85_552960 [compost metagenome]
MRLVLHLRYWWWVYVVVAVVLVIGGAISEKMERNSARQKALDDPTINHELVSTIGDCKVYRLKTDSYLYVSVCETSNVSLSSRR